MLRFTRKPSSGSQQPVLSKNYTLGSMWLHRGRTDVSIMAASQGILCSHNTDNVCTTSM
jgi:hypothetical protein